MNLLEERLKHSNSAVVLAATKVFLNLTQDMPEVHKQVYARLKAPMLTLIAGGVFEQGFNVLKHITLLTQRAPEVFADDFKHFYCRYNDPACVKLLKLEILTAVANPANLAEMMEEVADYVTDPDTSIARGAVSAIGGMALKVPSLAGPVVETLMKFLELDIDHVSAEAVLAMRDLLRKFPEGHERIVLVQRWYAGRPVYRFHVLCVNNRRNDGSRQLSSIESVKSTDCVRRRDEAEMLRHLDERRDAYLWVGETTLEMTQI